MDHSENNLPLPASGNTEIQNIYNSQEFLLDPYKKNAF
jgi:hypothetical protein